MLFVNKSMASVYFRSLLRSRFSYLMFISSKKCSSQPSLKTEITAVNETIPKISTLFVPGRHGANIYQIVKPVIDIDFISDNLGNLKLSCDHRLIDLDLDYTLKLAREWIILRNDYLKLVKEEQEVLNRFSRPNAIDVRKENLEAMNEKRKKLVGKIIKEKSKLHDIEDIVMPLFQKIPHVLHPNTPLQFNVSDKYEEPPTLDFEIKSHVEIAKSLSLLEFLDNPSISYFLSGKLAEIDISCQMFFSDRIKNSGFLPLSCMDFCKSFIIEAIGYDPYSTTDCIQVKNKEERELGQKLNLIGGASFEAFCGYLTNMNIAQSLLPLKYFCLGRRYTAGNNNEKARSLFSAVQSTNIHCVVLSETSLSNAFDDLLQIILKCYSEINIPFRTVNVSAKNLTPAESQRKQVELWSAALKDYIPIAYVSQHDDFISKRLQITYGIEHIKEGYCSIVEGSIVNVPILIGCIIENFQTKQSDFNIPDVLQKYITSFHE